MSEACGVGAIITLWLVWNLLEVVAVVAFEIIAVLLQKFGDVRILRIKYASENDAREMMKPKQ